MWVPLECLGGLGVLGVGAPGPGPAGVAWVGPQGWLGGWVEPGVCASRPESVGLALAGPQECLGGVGVSEGDAPGFGLVRVAL